MKKAVMKTQCPNCGKQAVLTELVKKIPLFGEALFSNVNCLHCKFNFNDIFNVESSQPVKFKALIENEKDLRIKIVKSSSSNVLIPEFGIKIISSPNSEGYYSNIEGLLDRIESVLKTLKEKKSNQFLEKIKKARKGKTKFTVILTDSKGNGALIGEKVKKLFF